MLADLVSLLGATLRRRIRSLAVTAALLLAGSIFIVLAFGMGYWALYLWLEREFGPMAALGVLGGASAILAAILFAMALRRASRQRRSQPPLFDEAFEIEKTVRRNPRDSAILSVVLALLIGWIVGRGTKRRQASHGRRGRLDRRR
jgi:hypothetical protein